MFTKGGRGADTVCVATTMDAMAMAERLDECLGCGRYEEAKEVAEEMMRRDEGDVDAARAAVAARLLGGKDDETTPKYVEAMAERWNVRMEFERAYAYYRIGKLDEAMGWLAAGKELDEHRGVPALKAQLLFRQRKPKEAAEALLEALGRKTRGDDANSTSALRSNLVAARVAQGDAAAAEEAEMQALADGNGGFETHFNVACARILRGNLRDARHALEEAKKAAVEEADAATVGAMEGYLDQDGEASLKHAQGDACVAAIAASNAAALGVPPNQALDVLDRYFVRQKHALVKEAVQATSAREQEVLQTNRALILWQLGQKKEAVKAAHIAAGLEDSSMQAQKVAIAIASMAGEHGKAEERLQQLLAQAKGAEEKREAHLLKAQTELRQNRPEGVLEALRAAGKMGDSAWKHMPSVVATTSTILCRTAGKLAAQQEISKAISYWEEERQNNNPKATGLLETLRLGLAQFAEKNGDTEVAEATYKALLDSAPSDHVAIASSQALVALYGKKGDVDAAQLHAQRLPSIHDAAQRVDVEALEMSTVLMPPASAGTGEDAGLGVDSSSPMQVDAPKLKRKKKHHKKRRMPKDFNPEHPPPPPDAERWLPLRERSYYKKSRREKAKANLRGAQGSAKVDPAATKGGKATGNAPVAPPSAPKRPHGSKKGRKGRR